MLTARANMVHRRLQLTAQLSAAFARIAGPSPVSWAKEAGALLSWLATGFYVEGMSPMERARQQHLPSVSFPEHSADLMLLPYELN